MTKEQLLEAIESMTVLELSELVKAMEEKFGVSAAAPVAAAAPAAAAAAAEAAETGLVPEAAPLLPSAPSSMHSTRGKQSKRMSLLEKHRAMQEG